MIEFDHYIFDFDLTLFDTLEGFEVCYKKAFSKVGIEVKKGDTEIFVKEGLRATFSRFSQPFDEMDYNVFEAEFLKWSQTVMAEKAKIYPDTFETVSVLKKCGKRLSIVTGKPKQRVIEILEKYGIDSIFDAIFGYGDYCKEKPEPDSIIQCIEACNIPREQTVYVGDSINDVLAAQNAGVVPILLCRNEKQSDFEQSCCPIIINSLKEMVRTIHLSLFSICSIKYDVFANSSYEAIISEWCERSHYTMNGISDVNCEIVINRQTQMNINKHGIIVFSELISVGDRSAESILKFKNDLSVSRINEPSAKIKSILYSFEAFIGIYIIKKAELNKLVSKWSTKVHYTLSSYLFSTMRDIDIYNYRSFISDEVVWLLTKKNPSLFGIKSIDEILEESEAKQVVIDDDNTLFALWGARIFIHSGDDIEVFKDYVSEERSVQNLWLLFNQTNIWIDSSINKRLSIKSLIDSSFELLFYEARYKHITSLRTHRYQIEIRNLLYQISNLNSIEGYFKEKIALFERKLQIESAEREKNSDSRMNITLFILTVVSTVSAIFQVINYWFDAPNNNIASIFIVVGVVVVIIIALTVRSFFANHRK